jgi:AraC-like DNA-binding protein
MYLINETKLLNTFLHILIFCAIFALIKMISGGHLINLFSYTSFLGIKESELRQLLHIPALDLSKANAIVTETEFLHIFKKAHELSKDVHFGLHYGFFLNFKALQFITRVAINATTFHQVLYILQNYFEHTFPLVRMRCIENKKGVKIEFNSRIKNSLLKQQILDIVMCFIYREMQVVLSPKAKLLLTFPTSITTEQKLYFKSKLAKGQKFQLLCRTCSLNEPINKKRSNELVILLPQFLILLNKKRYELKHFSAQVRNMLLNMCQPSLPSFEQVANQFAMSPRTLQRKLTFEGLSFRKISDDVKKELSIYLRKDNRLKTQDIAHILGYSEPSAYLHAVKKWSK